VTKFLSVKSIILTSCHKTHIGTIYSFIYSFILDISIVPSSSPLILRSAPDTARIPCRNFTLKRHRQLWVKNLPKDPARFKPTTVRLTGIVSTNEPLRPTN